VTQVLSASIIGDARMIFNGSATKWLTCTHLYVLHCVVVMPGQSVV